MIETLLTASQDTCASFYRIRAGAEVDLILEPGRTGERWMVEIKRGLNPGLTKGFRHALADLRPKHAFVVYSGEETCPLAERIEAISPGALARLIEAQA